MFVEYYDFTQLFRNAPITQKVQLHTDKTDFKNEINVLGEFAFLMKLIVF